MLEVADLVGQQEAVRHELVVNWEEALQSADDHTEDVLLGEVVHQRVAVEDALAHLDDVEVVVSEGHAVPEHRAVSRLVCLTVAVLADDVLDGV